MAPRNHWLRANNALQNWSSVVEPRVTNGMSVPRFCSDFFVKPISLFDEALIRRNATTQLLKSSGKSWAALDFVICCRHFVSISSTLPAGGSAYHALMRWPFLNMGDKTVQHFSDEKVTSHVELIPGTVQAFHVVFFCHGVRSRPDKLPLALLHPAAQ